MLAGRLISLLAGFTTEKLSVNAIYPARRISSTNLDAFVKNAQECLRYNPFVSIEEN